MKVMGCHLPLCRWESTAPKPTPEPSVSTWKGSVVVGMARMGAVVTACFQALKAS